MASFRVWLQFFLFSHPNQYHHSSSSWHYPKLWQSILLFAHESAVWVTSWRLYSKKLESEPGTNWVPSSRVFSGLTCLKHLMPIKCQSILAPHAPGKETYSRNLVGTKMPSPLGLKDVRKFPEGYQNQLYTYSTPRLCSAVCYREAGTPPLNNPFLSAIHSPLSFQPTSKPLFLGCMWENVQFFQHGTKGWWYFNARRELILPTQPGVWK